MRLGVSDLTRTVCPFSHDRCRQQRSSRPCQDHRPMPEPAHGTPNIPLDSHVVDIHGICDLQKEPKLARAKHIQEWEDYDSEIARFAKQLSEKGIIHSGMADADASVLADVGTATAATGSDAEVPLDDALQRNEEPDVGYHRKDEL